VSFDRKVKGAGPASAAEHGAGASVGKRTLTEQLAQRLEAAGASAGGNVHAAAAHGTSGAPTALPHFEQIQRSFGRHDVSLVQAHVGGLAAEGARAMGAQAYATGDRVAFMGTPDLHTAAHEAAHVVQQKGGVQLKGGVGESGDSYERHADAVADCVVQGKPAELLLDQVAGHATMMAVGGTTRSISATQTVQRKDVETPGGEQQNISGNIDPIQEKMLNALIKASKGDPALVAAATNVFTSSTAEQALKTINRLNQYQDAFSKYFWYSVVDELRQQVIEILVGKAGEGGPVPTPPATAASPKASQGEPSLDKSRSSGGGQKAVTGDIPGVPGKATLAGASANVEPASRNDPAVRPPEYAAMDPDCVRLLASSRASLEGFAGKPAPFWDLVDLQLSAAQLHSLTQTVNGARHAGLLSQINTLKKIYNFGSSWGIEFVELIGAPASGWGKDYPQNQVRAEHGNTAHDWYRQDSGAGNPGMHLGVNAGAGYTNLHWDPSNPMDHISEGTEGKNNPLLAMMPNPFKDTAPVEDAVVPKGCAVYNPKALLTHADDIGWIGKHAPFLKRFVPAHAHADGPNSSTEPFVSLSAARDPADQARNLANGELGRRSQMVDQIRGVTAAGRVVAAANAIDALEKSSRPLALEERTPANEAGRVKLAADLAAAFKELYEALGEFFHHLHQEVRSSSTEYETVNEWVALGGHVWKTQEKVWDMQAEREKKKAAP